MITHEGGFRPCHFDRDVADGPTEGSVLSGDTVGIFGRNREIAALGAFLDQLPDGPAAVVLEGDPGIGKTTVWEAGIDAAHARSYHLLSARSHEAEVKLPFAALGDLFDEVGEETLSALPAPQRRALEAALLRAEPRYELLHQRTVSVAVLGVLQALSQQQPVVVAIDDVQWLDRSSEAALAFALRRLRREPIGLLATARAPVPTDVLGLDENHSALQIAREGIGPVSRGALGRIVAAAHGGVLPRSLLIGVHRSSGGNPLFAIEIVREIGRRPEAVVPGEPLPVPRHLRELLRERVAEVPAPARESLLSVAALAAPERSLVERAPGGVEGVREALRSGVLTEKRKRLEPAHPLIGSVVYEATAPQERRELHRRLAEVVPEVEERARHLGLAAAGPNAEAAAALERAAATARRRGAPDAAAELSERAADLTPASDAARRRLRLVLAADHWFAAGDARRARTLLESAAEKAPPGAERADILWRLARVRYTSDSMTAAIELFEQALAETGDDELRAWIEQALAFAAPVAGDVPGGVAHARAALELAGRGDDPGLLALGLCRVASTEFIMGAGLDVAALDRAVKLERHVPEDIPVEWLPSFIYATCRMFADDLHGARALFEPLRRRALDHGDEGSLPPLLFLMSQLECLAGNWEVAERHAADGLEAARETGQEQVAAHALFARSLIDAHRGRLDAAWTAAQEGLAAAERTGVVGPITLIMSVLGFIELSAGDPAATHRHLDPLTTMLRQVGIGEPGAIRFLADEIEALIALGETEPAAELTDRLEERGRALDRAWALAAAGRCRGLLRAASGDPEGALEAFAGALGQHDRLEMPFERARTLLARGQAARRAKQWAAARASLVAALEVFDHLGAPLWAQKAREELARVGGRRRGPAELTATERQVAELVASGLSNPEVADALFLTRKSVEANLTKVYRKLGIRSRTQLAARLGAEHASR